MPAIPFLKSKAFILSIIVLQIAVYFVIYADILIARMIVCFLYLLFVPGFVILKVLSLKTPDASEKILFSVGLSIAFLMFIGVAINGIGKIFFNNPLSLNLLILSINTVLLFVAFIVNRQPSSNVTNSIRLELSKYLFLTLLCISLLLLGSYGIFIVNYSGNSYFILLLIVAISIIISVVFAKENIFPLNFYPFLLLIIFLCTLLFVATSYSLVTPYITGSGDQWLEYFTFRSTGNFWYSQLQTNSPFYSMLSITILPAIFSTITAMDTSFLFKLLYPLVASFVAIGAYKLYQTQTDNKTAFLATFFLITISIGKGMGPSRQEIAELFYVLLFLILLKKDIAPPKKTLLLIVFGVALILSHYSLTYLFLLTMIASFVILIFLDYSKTGQIRGFQEKIPLTFIVVVSVCSFAWYVFINGSAAFKPLTDMVSTVVSNLNQFFNPSSRGTALEGLGLVQTTSIYNSISSALFILTEFLMLLGFISLLIGKNKSLRFSIEYKIFASLNMAIIVINILLPRIADTFFDGKILSNNPHCSRSSGDYRRKSSVRFHTEA